MSSEICIYAIMVIMLCFAFLCIRCNKASRNQEINLETENNADQNYRVFRITENNIEMKNIEPPPSYETLFSERPNEYQFNRLTQISQI